MLPLVVGFVFKLFDSGVLSSSGLGIVYTLGGTVFLPLAEDDLNDYEIHFFVLYYFLQKVKCY